MCVPQWLATARLSWYERLRGSVTIASSLLLPRVLQHSLSIPVFPCSYRRNGITYILWPARPFDLRIKRTLTWTTRWDSTTLFISLCSRLFFSTSFSFRVLSAALPCDEFPWKICAIVLSTRRRRRPVIVPNSWFSLCTLYVYVCICVCTHTCSYKKDNFYPKIHTFYSCQKKYFIKETSINYFL